MRSIEIAVQGEPVPQGSKRCFCRNGKANLVESNKALRPWRQVITTTALGAAARANWETADNAINLTVTFRMSKPKSTRRGTPCVKPDLDKLLRAVLDGLTDARIWTDDSRVVLIDAHKTYAENGNEGVLIRVTERDYA